jgi:CPA1 family monovalent cation:H+ antiporter
MKDVHIHSILEFKEDLTVVFVSALFIVLAARLEFSGFAALGWSALLLLVVMQFIARPLKVAASFIGSDFSFKEKIMVAWIGPRGIVAAAVSAVFALRLEELGVPDAEKLVPLAFLIIIGTVVLQSLTGRPMAKALGVAMPKTYGLVMIGANTFTLALAEALNKHAVDTLVCDTNWEQLSHARNLGLATYYGNPSSDHADLHINLAPYGYMLGLANHYEYNVTQANSFREDFGARNVYILPPNQSSDRFHKHIASSHNSGRFLFSKESSHIHLKKLINTGAKVKVTELSNEYGYPQWREDNPNALMLLVLKSNGDLLFNNVDQPLRVEPGEKLFYLHQEI